MRHALLVTILGLGGCALYFEGPGDDATQPPPPSTDGGHPSEPATMARCEDGTLYRITSDPDASEQPGHGQGTTFGRCAGPCRSAAARCTDPACAAAKAALCVAPASTGKPCGLVGGSCADSEMIACPLSTTCGFAVPGATCTCTNGAYACPPPTGTAAVQAAIVGKWRGRVVPPSFAQPYEVSLWIYPDGTYWSECADAACAAFYYGGDGPHPWRKISVLSASATVGAWADIGVFTSFNVGALSAVVTTATKLTFTYNAAWHGCGQPFYFDLTRE